MIGSTIEVGDKIIQIWNSQKVGEYDIVKTTKTQAKTECDLKFRIQADGMKAIPVGRAGTPGIFKVEPKSYPSQN